MHVSLLARHLAAQIVLAQRWPLVRALRLRADQQNVAVEALIAERLRGLRGHEPRANDHERLESWVHVFLASAGALFLPLGSICSWALARQPAVNDRRQ